jgi:hypothetical protein
VIPRGRQLVTGLVLAAFGEGNCRPGVNLTTMGNRVMPDFAGAPSAPAPSSMRSERHGLMRLDVRGRVLGTWRLPGEPITVGRARGAAARLANERVPRILATVVPYSSTPSVLGSGKAPSQGWLLVNGERTRATAENRLASVDAEPSGVVALQDGTTTVSWPELDQDVTLTFLVGSGRPDPALPLARDRPPDAEASPIPTTFVPLKRSDVRPSLRHTMAVLFRYLLEGRPRPVNVYRTAAEQVGITEAAMKRSADRLMGRINAHRVCNPIDTLDHLGHYLVTTAALITTDDLRGDGAT